MSFSKNPDNHKAMAANIKNVLDEDNQHIRWHKALAFVASSRAYYAEPDDEVGKYCSVLAMVALYPEDYRAVNKE
jgi:hypothetical protein